MDSSDSVAFRAALALGLMLGFYLLALAIALGLLYLPYAEVVYAHRLHVKLALVCVVGAGTILWSIVPRIDRFVPPGPRLEPEHHPNLFSEIASVAVATGQEMPKEVYLVGDVNAWVTERGGIMGFFSRRVMGLGLPLLQVLTVSQFRAVLAHEFGHYYGGDTRLGPWVYKTRAAIGRTVTGLSESLLQKPFLWYGRLFLRVSHAVSRRQEFSADALASRVVGARPLVEGLKRVQAAAPAYDAYWSSEVAPVLNAGFLPPIMEGFERFTGQERVSAEMNGVLDRTLREGKSNPYDTHPALPERIAAVVHLSPGPQVENDPPAITLLAGLRDLERSWLESVAEPGGVKKLRALPWDAVIPEVFLPEWRAAVARNADALRGVTFETLGRAVAETRDRAARLEWPRGREDTPESRAAMFDWLLSVAMAVALQREGWTVEAPPGAPVIARLGDREIRPFEVIQALGNGSRSADDWSTEASRMGLNGKALLAE